jgi:hypothetical protein
MPQPNAEAQITRPIFAQVPIALLEQSAERSRRGALFVYCWLWHYAGRNDQAFPSIQRLAAECHMKPDDVRKALKWLTEEGWITRTDRAGSTSLFHVRYEKTPRRTPPPKGVPLPRKGDPLKGVTLPPEPLPQMGDPTPPPEGGPNKNQLTREELRKENPPLPPVEPEPTKAPAKADSRPFTPTEADIPEVLLPVASDLLDFWESKGGKKSKLAWTKLVKQLKLIQADVAGGTEVLREQLEAGVQVGWQSLTHKNWHRYGRQGPETLRLPNGSSRRTSTTITHDSRLQVGEFLRANGLA